jgi:hypothetical protein
MIDMKPPRRAVDPGENMAELDSVMSDDEEASLRAAIEQSKAALSASQRRVFEQEILNAQSGIRWGFVLLAFGGGLWLLSYTDWLPSNVISLLATQQMRQSFVLAAGGGLLLAGLNFLFVRAGRLGERNRNRFGTAMTVFVAVISFIVAAGVLTTILSLFVILLLEHMGETGVLLLVGGDAGLLLAVGGLVVVVMALGTAIACFSRRGSKLEPAHEPILAVGIIAFCGAMALTMAALACLSLGVVVRAIQDGHAAPAALFVGVAAANVYLLVLPLRMIRQCRLASH